MLPLSMLLALEACWEKGKSVQERKLCLANYFTAVIGKMPSNTDIFKGQVAAVSTRSMWSLATSV